MEELISESTEPIESTESHLQNNLISPQNNANIPEEIVEQDQAQQQEDSFFGEICAICHSDENKEELISPCVCKGSIRSQHQKCLQRWVATSKSLKCSICGYIYAYLPLKPTISDYLTWVKLFTLKFQEDLLVLFMVLTEVFQIDLYLMDYLFGTTLDALLYQEIVKSFLSKEHLQLLDSMQDKVIIALTILRGFLLTLFLYVFQMRLFPPSVLFLSLFLDSRWTNISPLLNGSALILIFVELFRTFPKMKQQCSSFAWCKQRYIFVNRNSIQEQTQTS